MPKLAVRHGNGAAGVGGPSSVCASISAPPGPLWRSMNISVNGPEGPASGKQPVTPEASSCSKSMRAEVIAPLASAARSALPSGGTATSAGCSAMYGTPESSHAPGFPPSGSIVYGLPLTLQPQASGLAPDSKSSTTSVAWTMAGRTTRQATARRRMESPERKRAPGR